MTSAPAAVLGQPLRDLSRALQQPPQETAPSSGRAPLSLWPLSSWSQEQLKSQERRDHGPTVTSTYGYKTE